MLSFLCLISTLGYSQTITKEYGDRFNIRMVRQVEFLEFRQKDKSDTVVLWNRTNPKMVRRSSQRIIGNFYFMYNLTQEDSGEYTTRNKNGLVMDTYNIVVVGEYL